MFVSQFFIRQLLEQELFHVKIYFSADLNKLKTFSFIFHEQHRCCLATSIKSTIDKNRNSTAEMDEVYFFSRTKDLQSFIHSLPGNEGRLNEFGVSVFVQFHPSHMETKEKPLEISFSCRKIQQAGKYILLNPLNSLSLFSCTAYVLSADVNQ